jgi:hypothetical protein
LDIFSWFVGKIPKKMSTDMASYTNSINSVHSSNDETKQVENAGPSMAEQMESSDTAESDSNLEAKLLQTEAEVGATDSSQSRESTNGDTHESVDNVEEEEWLDILGSGQLKKKVSTELNTQCLRSK